jgi:hypothetical protein
MMVEGGKLDGLIGRALPIAGRTVAGFVKIASGTHRSAALTTW